ncbi:hypothetical protein L873DRAFT_1799411 [Choiromyces venosus 120613-1]|uniref:BHLH domain-containing protein n=1 Tax=Choiromyces venosus 120613-1 TaxID=1336337 RepID=A0A3N4K1R8_9PEZI|nr:hypothetical protein L873DRAFT_1799411 [Choiromyces venosus 120613-1]
MEGNQPSAAETPVSPSLASEPGKASIARSETEPSVTTVITSSAPAETKPSDLTSDEKKPSAREGSLSPTNPTPIADSKDINTGPILPPPSSSSPPPTPTVPTNQHKRPSTSEPTPSSQTQAQQQSQPLPSPQTSKRRKTKAKSQEAKESSPTMASDRPRLSEQEKKNNHIASEQKRRMAIREGFDRLTEIVPGLEGQGRSESIVLKKSVDHMRDVLNERQELIRRIKALGGEIPPDLQ